MTVWVDTMKYPTHTVNMTLLKQLMLNILNSDVCSFMSFW